MKDTYVIHYTEHCQCWTAVSIEVGLARTGNSPPEALDHCIRAVDRLIEMTKRHGCTYPIKPVPELVLKLAKTAQPMPNNDDISGTVYSTNRIIEGFE